jgi:ketosteroid isomerase-like protein
MLNRHEVLDVIDAVYAARVKGDKAAMAQLWRDDATFQLMGEPSILQNLPLRPTAAVEAIGGLIDQFTFHSAEQIDAVVEGNKAAVLLRLTVSAADGTRHETHVFDMWELDDSGKACSLVQYADTALISFMLAATNMAS